MASVAVLGIPATGGRLVAIICPGLLPVPNVVKEEVTPFGSPVTDPKHSAAIYCLTQRFEGGFTWMPLCTTASAITESCYFTTADATSAWPGLPRLTGLGGIPTPTSPTNSNISPGALAGSVVGGVIFGALLCFAPIFAIHYRKKGQAPRYSLAQPNTQPTPNTDVAYNPAAPYPGLDSIDRRELVEDGTGWVELGADGTNPVELENISQHSSTQPVTHELGHN